MFCNTFNSDKSAVNILYFFQYLRCFLLSCIVFATLQTLQNIVKNTADSDLSKKLILHASYAHNISNGLRNNSN